MRRILRTARGAQHQVLEEAARCGGKAIGTTKALTEQAVNKTMARLPASTVQTVSRLGEGASAVAGSMRNMSVMVPRAARPGTPLSTCASSVEEGDEEGEEGGEEVALTPDLNPNPNPSPSPNPNPSPSPNPNPNRSPNPNPNQVAPTPRPRLSLMIVRDGSCFGPAGFGGLSGEGDSPAEPVEIAAARALLTPVAKRLASLIGFQQAKH